MEINTIKIRLKELTEDFIQDYVGEIVPNIEDKKQEFIKLHNNLRELEGKSKREVIIDKNILKV